MGANCCIARKERTQPCVTPVEVPSYRITRHSPSWNFRWDNRTHIEDIMEIPMMLSNHSSGSIRPETKSGSIAPTEGLSNGNSPSYVYQKAKGHKSDKKVEASKVMKADPGVAHSTTSNSSLEAKLSRKSLDMLSIASVSKTSISVPSMPTLVSGADASSSRDHSQQTNSFSMKEARQSPRYQLYRQVSDSKIPSLRSLNGISSPEGRTSSSMLSVCSNDLSAAGSHGESSDGWSMRTFSEMVATSQRERWSVDSELGSVSSKMSRSNASNPSTIPPDQEVCKLCLKLLKERLTWNAQELAVAAVLLCGHVYHADCLDSITTEVDKYDPPCPVCTHGEKCTVKLFGKLESMIKNKMLKNVIVDINLDGNIKHQKKGKREPRFGTNSSLKVPFSRPFLKRHFSIGSRPPRSALDNDSVRKKGFWSRHWRE